MDRADPHDFLERRRRRHDRPEGAAARERYVTCTDYREVIAAIKDLTVRGAPAIGVAAAMGIALGALRLSDASARGLPGRLR